MRSLGSTQSSPPSTRRRWRRPTAQFWPPRALASRPRRSTRRGARRTLLQWARAALHYDATNEEARWCEAKSLDALNRRLALAIKRYEELAALDTSPFGALARQRLETSTVRQRYQQQVEALSPGNVLNEESPVKNLKGVGEKTVEELPSKGSTPLREAVEHVRASGRRPGKKLESMFTALELVDEKPEPRRWPTAPRSRTLGCSSARCARAAPRASKSSRGTSRA